MNCLRVNLLVCNKKHGFLPKLLKEKKKQHQDYHKYIYKKLNKIVWKQNNKIKLIINWTILLSHLQSGASDVKSNRIASAVVVVERARRVHRFNWTKQDHVVHNEHHSYCWLSEFVL